jgi:hypothetical protein
VKHPPPADDKRLEAMRHCIHSCTHAESPDLRAATYRCGPQGKLCKLYRDAACTRYEPFPEEYDT